MSISRVGQNTPSSPLRSVQIASAGVVVIAITHLALVFFLKGEGYLVREGLAFTGIASSLGGAALIVFVVATCKRCSSRAPIPLTSASPPQTLRPQPLPTEVRRDASRLSRAPQESAPSSPPDQTLQPSQPLTVLPGSGGVSPPPPLFSQPSSLPLPPPSLARSIPIHHISLSPPLEIPPPIRIIPPPPSTLTSLPISVPPSSSSSSSPISTLSSSSSSSPPATLSSHRSLSSSSSSSPLTGASPPVTPTSIAAQWVRYGENMQRLLHAMIRCEASAQARTDKEIQDRITAIDTGINVLRTLIAEPIVQAGLVEWVGKIGRLMVISTEKERMARCKDLTQVLPQCRRLEALRREKLKPGQEGQCKKLVAWQTQPAFFVKNSVNMPMQGSLNRMIRPNDLIDDQLRDRKIQWALTLLWLKKNGINAETIDMIVNKFGGLGLILQNPMDAARIQGQLNTIVSAIGHAMVSVTYFGFKGGGRFRLVMDQFRANLPHFIIQAPFDTHHFMEALIQHSVDTHAAFTRADTSVTA